MNRKDLLNTLQNELRREKEFAKRRKEVISKHDAQEYTIAAESSEFIQKYKEFTERFIPEIKVNHPETFAFYGSAEKYYDSSFKYIHTSYPYDGSGLEKLEWSLSASSLDLAVLQHKYPKETGFVTFAPISWGSVSATSGRYALSNDQEYIKFSGGPYVGSLFDSETKRESSLKINGLGGNTLEFWMKKDSFVSSLTQTEVIFDSHTKNHAEGNAQYGRFLLELSSSSGSPFYLTYMSGTAGLDRAQVGSSLTSATIADGKWHHYAFAIEHTGSNLVTDVYVDGTHNATTKTSLASFGAVTDYFNGTIGALATQKDSTGGLGYGKLSGSLDEVRFWKTKRTAKDIGNYFDFPVNGATDSESINAAIGLYYKFNEGTISDTTQDKIILDYSGRLNNGEFVGYASDNRNSGSGISQSTVSQETELGDPIINSNSSRVKTALAALIKIGKEYDSTNNSYIFHSVPQWAYEPGAGSSNLDSDFSILLQAMASRFDSIKLLIDHIPKITRKRYDDFHFAKGSIAYHPDLYILLGCEREFVQKFANFGNVEVFSYSNLLAKNFDVKELPIINKLSFDEYFHNLKFSQTDEITNLGSFIDLSKAKQVSDKIMNSIYYDIDAIYKKKGTQSAFRNLIRCFGVDEKLVAPNIYVNNGEVLLKDNPTYEDVTIKSLEVLNTNSSTTLFQTSSASNSEERHFIAGKVSGSMSFEVRTLFPNTDSYTTDEIETSVFGCNEVSTSSINSATPNKAAFVVTSIKDARAFKGSRFRISSSAGMFNAVTSDYFPEVFDNTPWHLSARFSEDTSVPLANLNNKSTKSYKVELSGYQYELDTLVSSFNISSSISQADYLNFIQANKSVYIGAQRAQITGSVQKESENKFLSFAVWDDKLTNEEIKEHAKSSDNIGRFMAFSETDDNDGQSRIKIDTLILNWQFDDTTTAGTTVSVVDHASGSLNKIRDLGPVVGYKYPAATAGVVSTSTIVDTEHIYHIKYAPIDNAVGESKIEIKDREIDLFEIDSRPISYIYSYEKSAYQVMSRQMLRMVAGVSAFNNLIGEPIYKYRERYKSLDNIREKFFARIENDVDLERFIEYYKWVDSSLSKMLEQLQPATSEMKIGMEDVIESHAFERNKYKHQAPVFEFKDPDPNTNILGINELLYNWKRGNAGPATAATATITFTGTVADQLEALIITSVDADGTKTTKTYLAAGGNDAANGQFVREGGIAATAAGLKAAIEHNVRGHGNKIIVSVDGGVVTLTQAAKGKGGNVAIGGTLNDDANASVSGFSGGTGLDQAENCLWWQDRAERDGILSVEGAPNADRETLKIRANTFVEGSTYVIRKLSRPYRFAVERSNIISLGSNRNANKNKDLYKVIHSGKEITLNKSDIYEFKRCDDVINPQEEDVYTAKVDVDGTSGYLDADADMLLPFSLYSSSVGNDFSNFKDNLSITNNHDDQMPSLQGPFVRENVGGMPHRRVRYLTPDQDRAEAYIISASATTLTVKQPTGRKSILSRGRENFLNISNIKTNTNRDSHLITGTKLLAKMVPRTGVGTNAAQNGFSVSISGTKAIVGAPYRILSSNSTGAAYILSFDGTTWTQGPSPLILSASDGQADDSFGFSVGISGDRAIVGAYGEDAGGSAAGAAYVYSLQSGTWQQDAKLVADNAGSSDNFGYSVAISGDTAVIGAFQEDTKASNAGAAYVFTYSDGSWSQTTMLTASDGGFSDGFGRAVDISSNTIVVGSYSDDDSVSNSGAAYVYTLSGGTWSQTQKLKASDPGSVDNYGLAVAIDANVIVVGAKDEDPGGLSSAGSAYVYELSSGTWSQSAKLSAADAAASDEFALSVDVSGNNIIVGAPYDDDVASSAGSAYVFRKILGTWKQVRKITASDPSADDKYGYSVAISGKDVIVGAPEFDPEDGSTNEGAVYLYQRVNASWEDVSVKTLPVVGNYDKIYEIVQVHGRSINNRLLADSGSIPIEPISPGRVSGSIDYTIPARQRSEHVFVNRFSSPGGPETMAHGARDLESGEFSIYNSMNYRNLSVRDPLNRLHTERSDKLGYRSGSTTQASVHMTNRNFFYTRELTGAESEISIETANFNTVATGTLPSGWTSNESNEDVSLGPVVRQSSGSANRVIALTGSFDMISGSSGENEVPYAPGGLTGAGYTHNFRWVQYPETFSKNHLRVKFKAYEGRPGGDYGCANAPEDTNDYLWLQYSTSSTGPWIVAGDPVIPSTFGAGPSGRWELQNTITRDIINPNYPAGGYGTQVYLRWISHNTDSSSRTNAGAANDHWAIDDIEILEVISTSERAKDPDNFYIQHPIPQNDMQYAWITASSNTTAFEFVEANDGFGHQHSFTTGSKSAIEFVSSSTYQNPILYRELVVSDNPGSERKGDSSSKFFGLQVALAASRAYISVPYDNILGENTQAGYVEVFRKYGNSWVHEVNITASNDATSDHFGQEMDGVEDVLVAGTFEADIPASQAGAAYIFEKRPNASWQQVKLITGSYADHKVGSSVGVSPGGTNIIVGSAGDSGSYAGAGSVGIYNRSLGWAQTAFLTSSITSSVDNRRGFGTSVDIAETTAIVGTADNAMTGSVHVYKQNGTNNWEFHQELLPANPGIGKSQAFGQFCAISEEEDIILVSVPQDGFYYDGSGTIDQTNNIGSFFNAAGTVRIFEKQGEQYVETQTLFQDPPVASANFGYGGLLAKDGYLFVGAAFTTANAGFVDVFEKINGKWTRIKTILPQDYNTIKLTLENGSRFGFSIDTDGKDLLIGAPLADHGEASHRNFGSAFIFQRMGKSWADVEVNYAGVNLSIVDGVDEDTNTLAKVTDATAAQLITHRQGPYGWPTWKQIRGYEHPVARAHKKSNTFSRVFYGNPRKLDNLNKKAITFNGSDSYLQINSTRTIFAGDQFSVFTWIKHPEISLNSGHAIWGVNSGAGANRISLFLQGTSSSHNDGVISLFVRNEGHQKWSYVRRDDNEWHQIGIVYEKLSDTTATIELYVDGVSQGDKINVQPFSLNEGDELISIGAEWETSAGGTPSHFFNGQIADFIIWDQALTDTQAANLVKYSGLDSRSKGPIDINSRDDIPAAAVWYRMGDGTEFPAGRKDQITLTAGSEDHNIIFNNQSELYNATPVGTSMTIDDVSLVLPGDHFVLTEQTIVRGSQDLSMNAGYALAINRNPDVYERARNLDTAGGDGGPTFNFSRVIKNYEEPAVTSKYSPISVTMHGDQSHTAEMLNSFLGNWERGFDPRLPRFFMKRENIQKLDELQRERSWNLDNKYYETITNDIRLSEREELGNLGKYSISYGQVNLKKTFGNDIVTFANEQMLKDTFTKEPITNEALPFLDLLIDENDAEHHKLLEISYVETLYPREINVYNKNARARVNFDFFGWKALRANRDILLSGNIEHKPDEPLLADTSVSAFPKTISKNTKDYRKSFLGLFDAVDVSSYNVGNVGIVSHIDASSWVLDSRKDLTTYPTNITSSFINQSSSFLAVRDQGTRGEGFLQNDFSTFPLGYNGLYATPPFSIVYNRRIPQVSGSNVYLAGEAKWEAASGNLGPFYDSYEDYSYNDLRLIAKDHSIVPEFRMSEFVEEVLNGDRPYPDRRALENPLSYWPDFLSLTGSIHTDEEGNLEISGKSYKTYSNSDFLKYFKVVDDELMDSENPVAPTRLTLKCKAAMKFLPYRGFYPAERVAQIHELFHKNYLSEDVLQKARLRGDAPETDIQARRYVNLRANASRYQVTKALFGPGVLMNSIKSGVAVDYPIFTGSFHDVRNNLPASNPLYGSWPVDGSRLVPNNTTFTGSLVNQTEDLGIPRIKSTTTRRINFEDLLNPSNIYGVEIFDNEPHPSASLQYGSQKWNRIIERPAKFGTFERQSLFSDLGVRFSNNKKDFANQIAPYTLAMQNFAAETVNFFLEDGHLTTAMSKPIDEPFIKDEVYKMRVRISNNNNIMYDRHSAFGPPVDDSGTGLDLTKLTVSTTPTHSTSSFTFTDPDSYKPELLSKTNKVDLPRMTLFNVDGEVPRDAGFAGFIPNAELYFYRSSAAWAEQPTSYSNTAYDFLYIDVDQASSAEGLAILVKQQLDSTTHVSEYYNIERSGATITLKTKRFGQTSTTYAFTDASDIDFFSSGSASENILFGAHINLIFTSGASGDTSYYTESILPSTSSHGFAPYVPPFLDPNSDPYVEITFTPTADTGGSKNYTAQEIIDASTFEYYNFNEVPNNASTNTNYKESMSLSASLNLGICASLRTDNIETLAEGRAFISNQENPSTLRYETDIKVDINKKLNRWVIQTKWETPVMNFSNVSASALNLATGQEQMVSGSPWKDRYWDSYYSVGAESTGVTPGIFMTGSTGMWHQKGEVLTNQATAGQKKGYYLVVEDAPTGLPLATKLGFIDHREENETVKSLKRAKNYRTRIGMIEDRKMIKEAVVAIPYVLREDLPDNSPNKVQFITLDTELYQEARKNLEDINKELTNIPLSDLIASIDDYRDFLQNYNEKTRNLISDSPINAIEYQLMMMGDYILPPALDFRITGNEPFMMYFFQFRASLNQQDISNIWQNLYPESATSMANARYSCADRQYEGRNGRMGDVSYVSHYLDTISLLNENYCPVNKPYDLFSPRNTKNKTRWLVFKIKERGKTNLEQIRHRSLDPRANNIEKFEYIKEGQTSRTFETLDIQRISNRVGLGNTLQFNWPYDYFSFVELIKLEAKVDSYTYKKTE